MRSIQTVWLPLAAFFTAVGFCIGDLMVSYADLPDPVASRFAVDGSAIGWSPKGRFLTTSLGLLAALSAVLLGSAGLMLAAPASTMNLPNRGYWLAPERIAETRRMAFGRLLWIMAATMLLIAAIYHGVLQANLNPPPTLSMGGYLIPYLVFTVAWLVEFFWRFSKAPTERVVDD
ncbi:MAG: hypothetical protein AAGA92_09955 [Planctomycetota bacterium]